MCYSLKSAYRRRSDGLIIFDIPKDPDKYDFIYLRCGKCLECLKENASVWAARIMLEASLYQDNCFLTLTYADDCITSLHKDDVQRFVKRVRKHFSDRKIRVFYCGEYGGKNNRPHYHVIFFNLSFLDMYFWKRSKSGESLFRSDTLEKLWTLGFSTVQPLEYGNAFYCAKYLQKLDPRPHDIPPFINMSTNPGIGYGVIKPEMLVDDKIYCNGKIFPLPRYFLKVLEKQGYILSELKEKRIVSSLCSPDKAENKKFRKENAKKRLTFVKSSCYNNNII